MNFEKALESMKQGKKVKRTCWESGYIFFDFIGNLSLENGELFNFNRSAAEANDWIIYEEPHEETEMTAEKAVECLESLKQLLRPVREFDEVIDFAIETIENQNKPENKCQCDCKCKNNEENRELAFNKFVAGLEFGLQIAEDIKKENANNA